MKNYLIRLKERLLHNFALKIGSLLLAVIIWFVVAQVGDPKDTRPFNNIPVRLINTELLKDQNKVYEVLENTDRVRVMVTAPTSVFQTLRSSDIVAEADVSKLTDINTIAISYSIPNANYGVIDFEGDHDVVKLSVEERASKWITVEYQTTGKVADGYIVGNTKGDQTRISVSGPKSLVDQIRDAYAEINIEGVSKDISARVNLVLRNADKEVLEFGDRVTHTDTVSINVEVLSVKEVGVSASCYGTPAEGYVQVGLPEVSHPQITIAGVSSAVNSVSKILIPADKINIDGATDTVVVTVNLKELVSEKIRFADPDFDGKVQVIVTVKPSREKKLDVPVSNITIAGIPAGYVAEPVAESPEDEKVSLTIYGLREVVNTIYAHNTRGIVNLEAWMKKEGMTTPAEGVYEVPVSYELNEAVTVRESARLKVRVSKAE